MEIKKIQLNKNSKLIYLHNPNIKVATLSIYLKRPLNKQEVTMNALLPDVLRCGTQRLNTELEIDKEMQELYGMKVSFNTLKAGEKQILSFRMLSCSDKYLPEPILEKSLHLLKELMYEPYIQNNSFKKEYVEIEKEVLKEDILAKINNKGSYAASKCIENMCKDEIFSIPEEGYIEDLEKINGENLYTHYKNIINTSPMDIIFVGDTDVEKLAQILKENFTKENQETITIPEDNVIKNVQEIKYCKEEMDISQGKLVMGYRTGVEVRDKNFYDMYIYSAILGSGVSSKLFRNVREKNSLCYSISSSLEKFKGLMFISAGIETTNYELALKLINKEVDDMKQGNITDEELESAKKHMINMIKSVKDSSVSIADYYYSLQLQGSDDNADQIIEKISKVTKQGIIDVAQNIKLDTVYFLTKKEGEINGNN